MKIKKIFLNTKTAAYMGLKELKGITGGRRRQIALDKAETYPAEEPLTPDQLEEVKGGRRRNIAYDKAETYPVDEPLDSPETEEAEE